MFSVASTYCSLVSLYTGHVAYQAGAYPDDWSTKRPGWDASSSIKVTSTYLHKLVKRLYESKIVLLKNTAQCPQPGSNPDRSIGDERTNLKL